MTKQQERKSGPLPAVGGGTPPALAELRAMRMAQKATNQRVEELKLKLFRVTEQHMDQAISLIRKWMDTKKK